LSPREREVLRLLTLGLTNGEIADRLVLGEATVKTHIGSILAKLGLRDRVAAVIFGYQSGIAEVGETDAS
jgi:DNA-binding NarL/FixJ family response regulator